MDGIWLPAAAITISLFLLIIFFIKKNMDNDEVKIYGNLVVINLLFSINALVGYLLLGKVDISIISILQKLHLSLLFLLMYEIFKYNVCINSFSVNEKNKIYNETKIINFVIIILILILPVNTIYYDDILDIGGYSYEMCIFAILTYFVLLVFLNVIYFFNHHNIKKNIPFVILSILIIISLYLRVIYPEITTETYCSSFVLLVMYFTIENPDVKMINELNIAKDEAIKANQAKTDFLSSMSHEIRTPLNAIVGFSESLKEENLSGESLEEVNDIIDASQTLLEIVNGILDISKIEANKIEIVNTEYNFNKIFKELVSLSKARLGESKPIEFRYHMDASIPATMYGDYARIKQITLNLLTNSIKYTDSGYIDFEVNSIINGETCRLIISVEDSGRGIKKESINKLFTKFERLDEKNTTIEGTGLGLAITKKLVEMMGGKIIVQSIYGKGSKFTVILDQRIVKLKEDKPVTSETVDNPDEIKDYHDKKVLVVDDNTLNLKVASRMLREYRCQIELVDSGFKCIDLVASGNKYDLILMDDMMPKLSGTDTLHRLKENASFNMPVVALTANAISGMREKYLADGFDEYLAKPIEKSELNTIINKFLGK
jgi:signal transduction histidine kinase